MTPNHRRCGADHEDPLSVVRCDYEEAMRESLIAHAAGLDHPPTKAQLHDLWAHANTIHGDGTMSARWVRQVLDLGWRPTVGT